MRVTGTSSGINGLGERLKCINPNNGWNVDSNCIACAEETADTLTLGKDPVPAGDRWEEFMSKRTATKKFKGDSPDQVWDWCFANLQVGTVYAVYLESEGDGFIHAWNLVRDDGGRIYLIDSNQHLFKQFQQASDGPSEVRNHPEDETNRTTTMNYLSAINAKLVVYVWGPMHSRWKSILQG